MVVALALFAAFGQTATSHAWLREEWTSIKDRGIYRDFRLRCEDLKWGLKSPVDVPDLEAIDALFEKHLADFRSRKTADNAFYVVCLMAHFGNRKGADVVVQLASLLPRAAGYGSYEFSRVAFVAYTLEVNPPLPATGIERRLFDRRPDDPRKVGDHPQDAEPFLPL